MKNLFILSAIAISFVACNSETSATLEQSDSTATTVDTIPTVTPADTTTINVDTAGHDCVVNTK